MTPDPASLSSWLVLWRVPGVGPRLFHRLLEHFGDPATALGTGRAALGQAGLGESVVEAVLAAGPQAAEADLAWLEAPDHHLLTWSDPRYPSRLREIGDAPPVLFVHGDPDLLAHPQLAVVGSRNPTPTGREIAAAFAEHLAACGLGITSGLALGIDAAAHQGALAAAGITIAVAGTGLDRVYPRQHRELAHRIADSGALVSEFPIGTSVRPEHFPRRNRIISGLSLGTLVVEAARQSGSLITARCAVEQGREVFAIPGSIHNPLSRGCHQLLREGAKLVETARDVLEELGSIAAPEPAAEVGRAAAPEAGPAWDSDYRQLLDSLGFEPTPVDVLVQRSGLTAETVSSMLLMLELHDEVASTSGGLYVRLTPRGADERDRA
jgi:DNA processing protein